MCEFCVKHGEGKKWYLNARNYSDDLLSDLKRRKLVKETFYWLNSLYHTKFRNVKYLALKTPIIGDFFKGMLKRTFQDKHWGQVIPIEDVERVLAFTNSITRIPCVCRATTTGKECRLCFLISLDPNKIGAADIVDRSFFKGPDVTKFEKVSKEWAIDFFRENEAHGRIHTIWTLKSPFIAGLCNCDLSTGCLALKMYKEVIPIMFRAEYVALIDADKCIGCKACIKKCQFRAIHYDVITKKASIDLKRCYGCGICRLSCKKRAIILSDRSQVPQVANLW